MIITRRFQGRLLVTSPSTFRRENHHFCQKWLFRCLKSVVHISTQVLLEQCEMMYFCCCTSRIRVAVCNGQKIIPFPLPFPLPAPAKKVPNTCILRISNKNTLVGKVSLHIMPFLNLVPNILGLFNNRGKRLSYELSL